MTFFTDSKSLVQVIVVWHLTCSWFWAVGSPDELLISSFEFEKRFFEFVEGRASRGETPIYGHEDSWWQGLYGSDFVLALECCSDTISCLAFTSETKLPVFLACDRLKCTDKIDQQMCQRCGNHCESWDWDTSGYALLNSTELEIEDLYWSNPPTRPNACVVVSGSPSVPNIRVSPSPVARLIFST